AIAAQDAIPPHRNRTFPGGHTLGTREDQIMKRLLGTIALLISCACVATGSELRETIERYDADHRAVSHIYSVCPSGRAGGSRRFGGCFEEPSAARLARSEEHT